MEQYLSARLLDQERLGVEELAACCSVTREWVIEHVEGGVLMSAAGAGPEEWTFSSRELLRARQLRLLERDFDANIELAGLIVDLVEEVERLRVRLRRTGHL